MEQRVQFGSLLNLSPLIYNVTITPETTFSFNVSAIIDTKNKPAVVSIEYGLTTAYGSEVVVNESPINGIKIVTALLSLN